MHLFVSGVNVQTGEEVAVKLVSAVIDLYWTSKFKPYQLVMFYVSSAYMGFIAVKLK